MNKSTQLEQAINKYIQSLIDEQWSEEYSITVEYLAPSYSIKIEFPCFPEFDLSFTVKADKESLSNIMYRIDNSQISMLQ